MNPSPGVQGVRMERLTNDMLTYQLSRLATNSHEWTVKRS